MKQIIALLAVSAAVVLAGCDRKSPGSIQDASEPVTLSSCLRELTNVSCIARRPGGWAGMVSSYDRSGGNNDYMPFTKPDADGLFTIAKLTGPGCVTRMWMTSIVAQEWLFYFDGEERPRIRAKNTDFFGGMDPFLPPLGGNVSGGHYNYTPIPYEKSLRIAIVFTNYTSDMRPYFHVNYLTYPAGTRVVSFPSLVSPGERALAGEVRDFWKGLKGASGFDPVEYDSRTDVVISPGESKLLLEERGPGEISSFVVRLDFDQGTPYILRSRMLRDLVLAMHWDGSGKASVEAPLGDFFCNGRFRREFDALPMACRGNSYVCRLPMPFEKSAKVEIRNEGTAAVKLAAGFKVRAAGKGAAAANGYLHANWKQVSREGAPFHMLKARGRGHYVGCYLTEIGMDGGWNMFEGDESIVVDGGRVPSMQGTGMEDYFNGAWYYSGLFDLPLHGLIEKAPIRSSQYRFHMLDAVPFENSITVDFEFGDANRGRGYMSGVAYWYQDKPVAANEQELPPAMDRVLPKDPLEPAAIIGRLIELDRIGHYSEAMEQSYYYAESLQNTYLQSMQPILKVRAEAYRELCEGWDKARPNLAALTNAYPGTEAEKQAGMLIWFHEAPTNALLGIHPMGKQKVYLDGNFVCEADNQSSLFVFPVTVAPGEHEIQVELSPTARDGLFSFFLRTHSTNILADKEWEYVKTIPPGWPNTAGADVRWERVEKAVYMVPSMAIWQLMPNGFPNMQAGRNLVRPWDQWSNDGTTAYMRRRFVLE